MLDNPFDFFQYKLCLNLPSQEDEWNICKEHCQSVGLNQVERFEAVPGKTPGASFTLSQKAMLEKFINTKYDNCLLIEDDIKFREWEGYKKVITSGTTLYLPLVLQELPTDWDILYLGGNIQGNSFKRVSDHLFKVTNVWTTHAVAYRRKVVEYILENFPDENIMYDNWLGAKVLPQFNCFMAYPMIAWQRERKSNLWGNDVNYDPVFQHAENKMKYS